MIDPRTWAEVAQFAKKINRDPKDLDSTGLHQHRKDLSLALFMEVAEMTDSFQWKPWRPFAPPDMDNLERELVDILIFVVHLAEAFGLTPADLLERFRLVMDNNVARYVDTTTTKFVGHYPEGSISARITRTPE